MPPGRGPDRVEGAAPADGLRPPVPAAGADARPHRPPRRGAGPAHRVGRHAFLEDPIDVPARELDGAPDLQQQGVRLVAVVVITEMRGARPPAQAPGLAAILGRRIRS